MNIKYIVLPALLLMSLPGFSQNCACCSAGCGNSVYSFSANDPGGSEKGTLRIDLSGEYRKFRSLTGTERFYEVDRYGLTSDLGNTVAGTAKVSYGLTDRFAVSAALPYLLIKSTFYSSTAAYAASRKGIADITVTGTYRLLKNKKSKTGLYLLAGLELPVGRRFDSSAVVFGSGSYDPVAGLMFSRGLGACLLKGSVIYKLTTTGYGNTDYGDVFGHSLSLLYPIKRATSDTTCKKEILKLSCSLSGERIFPQTRDNVQLVNTGGYYLFAGAGIVFKPGAKTMFPVTAELPVYQKLSGTQNRTFLRVKAGLIFLLS